MKPLVKIEGGMLLTDTQAVASQFGMKNAVVMRTVDSLLRDYPQIKGDSESPLNPEYLRFESRTYRGKTFEIAVLNERCLALLMMRFETPRARVIQQEFSRQFFEMREIIRRTQINQADPEWLTIRQRSKLGRHTATEAISAFVSYANTQGSQSAVRYYGTITRTIYVSLGLLEHDRKRLRESLDALQLSQLLVAEALVAKSLTKHMAAGLPYRKIFVLLKQDLQRLAEAI